MQGSPEQVLHTQADGSEGHGMIKRISFTDREATCYEDIKKLKKN